MENQCIQCIQCLPPLLDQLLRRLKLLLRGQFSAHINHLALPFHHPQALFRSRIAERDIAAALKSVR